MRRDLFKKSTAKRFTTGIQGLVFGQASSPHPGETVPIGPLPGETVIIWNQNGFERNIKTDKTGRYKIYVEASKYPYYVKTAKPSKEGVVAIQVSEFGGDMTFEASLQRYYTCNFVLR